jgi:hypothetical protein
VDKTRPDGKQQHPNNREFDALLKARAMALPEIEFFR